MAQRRPVTHHPAFVVLIALWFAALLGGGIAVLPAAMREQALGGVGLAGLAPLAASGLAAFLGALLGVALSWPLARRRHRDPRPTYAEAEEPFEHAVGQEPARRPLRVREELDDDDPGDDAAKNDSPAVTPSANAPAIGEAAEGFMILRLQSLHPPRQAPDLDGLLAQFDTALAAFRSGEDERPSRPGGDGDPVHAFVARQTGTPAPSPLGGRMPDHQAELRAALDKLARAHRKD